MIKSIFLSLFKRVKSFIWKIPSRLLQLAINFANWGRRQLDRRITEEQKEHLHTIVFKTETPQGRRFDTFLIWIIVASILIVILETVAQFNRAYWWTFFVLEWVFTLIFTVEYILRLYCAKNAMRYAFSFYGIVDLLALLPTYISIFFIGAQQLLIIRGLRLLRIFRIFKMGKFVDEGGVIVNALKASRNKIYVFISFILLMSMLIGALLYIVEGGKNPQFSNIPKGIYWAIVTLTTVGYGDITPITPLGQFLATLVMVLGYGVIAVPTGIVTAEISSRVMNMKEVVFKECNHCGQTEHHTAAIYCHRCGTHI